MKFLMIAGLLMTSTVFADNYLFERGMAEGKTPFSIMTEAFKLAKPVHLEAAFSTCIKGSRMPLFTRMPLKAVITETTQFSDIEVGTQPQCFYENNEVITAARPAVGNLFPARPAVINQKLAIIYFFGLNNNNYGFVPDVVLNESSLLTKKNENGVSTYSRKGKNVICGETVTTLRVRELDSQMIVQYEDLSSKCSPAMSYNYFTRI